MNVTRQGCIDLLKKAAYEAWQWDSRRKPIGFVLTCYITVENKKVSKIIYNIYNIFI